MSSFNTTKRNLRNSFGIEDYHLSLLFKTRIADEAFQNKAEFKLCRNGSRQVN